MIKILSIATALCLAAGAAQAQDKKEVKTPLKDSVEIPYIKYPTLPAFNIELLDSTTIFNTYNIPSGKATAIFFFSPDCGHCRRTTRRLLDSMDLLQDVSFYMITPNHDREEINKFYAEFELGKYSNIKLVGRDYEFFFSSYYNAHVVPDIVLYDQHKKLIKLIEGETNAQAVYDALHYR